MMMPPGEEVAMSDEVNNFPRKKGNTLPLWGNVQSMNLNPLILTNIQASPYFKTQLVNLTTYHEVIDEIYYKVAHLEPWERGSRSTAGQTGMCGGVRGVGAGGIVSSAFCLLFKLLDLRITRKQLNGLINHKDSPYIRGLGFMYIRYTQPPADLWEWYEPYLDDEEEIDVKAGGGKMLTMGELVTAFLQKLEWFDTRFPRIPVNVSKVVMERLKARKQTLYPLPLADVSRHNSRDRERNESGDARRDRSIKERSRERERSRGRSVRSRDHSTRERSRDRERRSRERSVRDKSRERSYERRKKRSRSRSRSRKHRRRDYSRSSSPEDRRSSHKKKRDRSKSRKRSKKSKKRRSRSRSRY